MNAPWFHLDPLPGPGEVASLDEDEARHAGGARRLHEGDPVVVFDGAGGYADATLRSISRRAISLKVGVPRRQPRPTPDIHLACAPPKGDRSAILLGMATQLGMRSFTPLRCEHSVVASSAARRGRWSRILREACKQSRRAYIPELREPMAPLAAIDGAAADARHLLLDPDGVPAAHWLAAQRRGDPAPIQLLVGPEGGFSSEERAELIARGATPMRTADAVLRIETAALAGLTTAGLLRDETMRAGPPPGDAER